MDLLSLGLLKDERQDETVQTNSSEDSVKLARGSGTFRRNAKSAASLGDVQSEPKAATGSGQGNADDSRKVGASDSHDLDLTDEVSNLPPAVEELRLRLASATGFKPVFRRPNDGTPTFATFKFGYLPTKGLLYSTIAHEVALFLLFMLFHYGLPQLRSQRLIADTAQDHVIFLPEIGGGKVGETSPGGGPSTPKEPSPEPAHASKGFAYPARQAILSDPPNPTNAFQTLQRPLLVHPEHLSKLIPLPNIVQMAETRLPKDLIAPKPAMPQLHAVPQPIRVKKDGITHRDAQWKVPTTTPPELMAKAEMPKLPAAAEPLPQTPNLKLPPKEEENRQVEKPSPKPIKVTAEKRAEKSQKEVTALSAAQVARLEMHGKAPEPLVSLSPMPLPPGSDVKIPNGETRGRFALAPGGTLNPNSLTPGKMNIPLSTSPGMGQDKSQSANAATQVASNAGLPGGHNSSVGGGSGTSKEGIGAGTAGAGVGSGNTSGSGTGAPGNGAGKGSAGKGAGADSGRGSGTGSGGGSGPGSGAFQGITIQGGQGIEGLQVAKNEPLSYTIAPQAPYDMTVVATASSGGGLPDFGVFRDERVFTVYVGMKRTPEEEDPTWTLQYSLLKDDPGNPLGEQTVLAPSPVVREWPQLPANLVARYGQRQVVLYAVVDKDGKVSSVSVKQTPDWRISSPIIEALSKWVFRPAQLNNQPVAVKILIGIPIG